MADNYIISDMVQEVIEDDTIPISAVLFIYSYFYGNMISVRQTGILLNHIKNGRVA